MKKKFRQIILPGIFSLIGLGAYSQQGPMFSQYMVNKFLINPAIAGANGYTDIALIAKEQFVGFQNAPRTFALTAHSRMLEESYIRKMLRVRKNANQASIFTNVGLGGGIFSDRNGIVTKTGIQLAYGYHINFNNRYQLSMGLSGSAFQYKLDDSEAIIVDTDDPVLLGNKKQFWVPDATFGLYFTDKRSYLGLTMTDLFGSGIRLGNDPIKENFSSLRNFNVMTGTSLNLNDQFRMEPSLLLRLNSLSTSLDINTQLYYQDSYWFGISYRTTQALVAMVGINIERYRFAYAYDASLSAVRNYSSGSHEIIFGVRLGDNSTKRYRWLRKDNMEFDI